MPGRELEALRLADRAVQLAGLPVDFIGLGHIELWRTVPRRAKPVQIHGAVQLVLASLAWLFASMRQIVALLLRLAASRSHD